ncbi:MAG: DUF58 domain-containing protein [Gammaproteobacteria bacterium]
MAARYDDVTRVHAAALVRLAGPAASLPALSRAARAPLQGAHLSRLRGRGMEFAEVRRYEPGDDVRSLDWKVTARTGQAFTKLFREERERPAVVAVDLRAPMFFATRGAFKAVAAAHAAALLAWAAVHGGDRIGGLVFDESAHTEVKPARGRRGALAFVRALAGHPAWDRRAAGGQAALATQVGRLRRVIKTGALVVLASDFRDLDAAAGAGIAGIARHNDLLLLQVHDPIERQAPPPGTYVITDGTRRFAIDSRSEAARARYARQYEARLERLHQLAARTGARLIALCTADDPLATLAAGLQPRAEPRHVAGRSPAA